LTSDHPMTEARTSRRSDIKVALLCVGGVATIGAAGTSQGPKLFQQRVQFSGVAGGQCNDHACPCKAAGKRAAEAGSGPDDNGNLWVLGRHQSRSVEP